MVVLILGASMTQIFHATLHRRDVGFCVRAMRRLGLLMSVSAHKLHHDTLRKDFSVISWMIPTLQSNLCATLLLRIGALRSEGLEPT